MPPDAHGVVAVRTSSSLVHRPEYGLPHRPSDLNVEDWELFPNVVMAVSAGNTLCEVCYVPEQPGWVQGS